MRKVLLSVCIMVTLTLSSTAIAHAPWKHETELRAPLAHWIDYLRTQTQKLRAEKCLTKFQVQFKRAGNMPEGMRPWARELWSKRLAKANKADSACMSSLPHYDALYRIAVCETGGINGGVPLWTHSNSSYQGALGFAISTWDGFAPDGFPSEAYLASPYQQMVVGEILIDHYGYTPWPACSIRLGLR